MALNAEERNELRGMFDELKADLKKDLSSLESKIKNVQSDVKSVKDDYAGLKNSISNLDQRYRGIDAGLNAMRSIGPDNGMGGLPPLVHDSAERSTTPKTFVYRGMRAFLEE